MQLFSHYSLDSFFSACVLSSLHTLQFSVCPPALFPPKKVKELRLKIMNTATTVCT